MCVCLRGHIRNKHLKATGPGKRVRSVKMEEDEATKLEWGTLCQPNKAPPYLCPRGGGFQSSACTEPREGRLRAWGPRWGRTAEGTCGLGLGEDTGVCLIQKEERRRERSISFRKEKQLVARRPGGGVACVGVACTGRNRREWRGISSEGGRGG